MTDEDKTVWKLKGYNFLIKFKDGEELPQYSEDLDDGTNATALWFQDVEKFINGCDESVVEYFPCKGLALTRDTVKYIIRL